MPFAYQRLSVDDYEKIRLIDPNGFYPAGPPKYWVVDVERDIKLAHLGGQGSSSASSDLMPDFYLMLWRQHKVRFESRYTATISDGVETIKQDVLAIYASKELELEESAIRVAISEAIDADWRARLSLHKSVWYAIGTVSVNISAINFVLQGVSS